MLRRGAPKLDENGKPMRDARGKVIYEPYRIKVLNTINFKKSMKYNPFAYIRSEKDILKLVNVIIANTKGDEEKSSEDFWVKAERLLYRLTTLEQFREFPANTEYFVLEPNIRKVEDVGWRYLAQHLDVLLPPELLDAIDPVPFGNHAMREEQGCFTSKGYLTLSGDEWEHERPREKRIEKKPSIKERLEQSRKECAGQSKAQPHRENPAPER